jgi:hypothetical protein
MAEITPDATWYDIIVKADQGASQTQQVNAIIIPAGHDLGNHTHTLEMERSTDDAVWDTPAGWVTINPILSGIIVGTFTLETYRYWRVTLGNFSGDVIAHDIPEIFFTRTYEISRLPYRTSNAPINALHNAEREMSVSGDDRFTRYGPSKWRAVYPWRLDEADKDIMLGLLDGVGNVGGQCWRGQKPFYLKDVGGTWRYVTITNDPKIVEIAYQQYEVTLELQEVVS